MWLCKFVQIKQNCLEHEYVPIKTWLKTLTDSLKYDIHGPAAGVGGARSVLGTVSLQGDDHSFQVMQRQVDGLGFCQLLAVYPCLGHSL